jgi:hypothetical protein
MGDQTNQADDQALGELRRALLRARPPSLRPDQGDEALQQHKVVITAVQRASRLHQSSSDSETKAWIRYIVDFYPEGRNEEADAFILWEGWRCSLLKDDKPTVPVTHGQSEAHWVRDDAGRPCQNLEDAWSDYEHSVNRFLEHLRIDARRKEVALTRWRETTWEVRRFAALAGATVMDTGTQGAMSASVVSSPVSITLPEDEKESPA